MRASAKNYKSESDIQGRGRPEPGTYHVIVESDGVKENAVKKDGTSMNCSIVPCEVLSGTVPGQEGKEITLFLQFDDKGNPSEKHFRFCMASGLLKPGEERDFDFEAEAPGKQLVVQVEHYTDKGGKQQLSVGEYGLAMWHVNNKDVTNVPKNAQALALLANAQAKTMAGAPVTTGGNGNGSATPATSDTDYSNV